MVEVLISGSVVRVCDLWLERYDYKLTPCQSRLRTAVGPV